MLKCYVTTYRSHAELLAVRSCWNFHCYLDLCSWTPSINT